MICVWIKSSRSFHYKPWFHIPITRNLGPISLWKEYRDTYVCFHSSRGWWKLWPSCCIILWHHTEKGKRGGEEREEGCQWAVEGGMGSHGTFLWWTKSQVNAIASFMNVHPSFLSHLLKGLPLTIALRVPFPACWPWCVCVGGFIQIIVEGVKFCDKPVPYGMSTMVVSW